MVDELRDEPGTPHGLARVFGAEAGRRHASTAVIAFVAGLVGTAAFAGSLLYDWQLVTTALDDEEPLTVVFGLGSASHAAVYLLGVLGLLATLGAVVARPALAARLRLPVAGAGLGLLVVIVAAVYQIRDDPFEIRTLSLFGELPEEVQERIDSLTYSHEPGVFLAFGAVLVLVAGVFLAAGQLPDRGTGGPAAAAIAPGYVLVPAYPAPAAGPLPGAVTGAAASPTPATQAPATQAPPAQPPASQAPVAPVHGGLRSPYAPDPVARFAPVARPASGGAVGVGDAPLTDADDVPAGPPGLPLDSATSSNGLTTRAGYVDELTVTTADLTDPGSQADILRQ